MLHYCLLYGHVMVVIDKVNKVSCCSRCGHKRTY